MEAKTTRLYDIATTAGPDINVTKARSIRINAWRPPSLLMAEPARKLMSRTGGIDEDIKARGNNEYGKVKTSAVARQQQLYEAEAWRRAKKLDHKLQVFNNTCLRQILRLRWPLLTKNCG